MKAYSVIKNKKGIHSYASTKKIKEKVSYR